MRRSIFTAALGSALAAPHVALAQTKPPLTIKVGIIPAEVASEVWFGIENGFFKKQNLEVEVNVMNSGAAIAAAVAGGSLDIGFCDTMIVTSAHAKGLPFVYVFPGIVSSAKAPALGIIVKADSGIREAKDFNGKTVGVNALQNISHVPVEAWIDRNGGDSKTVKWVELPLPAGPAAVQAGTINAMAEGEPFITAGVELGQRAILMEKNPIAPAFMLSGWMTTRPWLESHRDAASRFVAAMRETAQWANANHPASAVLLAKYTKLPQATIEKMHRGEFSESFDAAHIQPVIDNAAKYGVIDKSFPASDIYTVVR